MRIIDLALKDLLQIVRDWRAAVFLVVMPIAFTIMFGFAFGGFGGGDSGDSRLPVGLIDLDEGQLSPRLWSSLEASQVIAIQLVEVTIAEAEEMVTEDELAAVIIIPTDYSRELLAGNPLPLEIVADTNENAGRTVQGEVQRLAQRLRGGVRTALIGENIMQRELAIESDVESREAFDEAVGMTLSAWENPPVSLTMTTSSAISAEDEEAEIENAFAQSSPGMMAQFAIAGLMGASTILVLERKNRTMRRLLTTAISKTEILLGHYLAMFVMIFVQLMILILFGQLLLRLDYISHPGATLLMAAATALFAASLGLLIGAVAKTEEQVIVLAMIPMFVLAGLGGAWVPLEITPEGFQQIARYTPLAFVMDGFQDIIIRDLGLESLVLNLVILLAFAVVLFAIGTWQFRYE